MTPNTEELIRGGTKSKVERYNWTVQDEPGSFQLLDKRLLVVAEEYQRQANDAKVKALSREWSWIACGAIAVGERDGTFYVIDGQHRVMAACRRADVRELPCIVFQTAGVRQEAQAFLRANAMRKPVTSVDKFKALTVTQDETAVRANALVAASGRTVRLNASPTTIRCIGLIQRLVQQDADALERIWPVLIDLCEGHIFHERLVDGLFYIEQRMPEGQSLRDREWRLRVLRAGYSRLLEGANRGASFFARGGAKAWASGIVEELNRKCRNRLELSDGR